MWMKRFRNGVSLGDVACRNPADFARYVSREYYREDPFQRPENQIPAGRLFGDIEIRFKSVA